MYAWLAIEWWMHESKNKLKLLAQNSSSIGCYCAHKDDVAPWCSSRYIDELEFWKHYVVVFISRNPVICNLFLCNYVQLNVAYDYKRLPMWLFFKFGWILVFFSTSCNWYLFHHSNRLILHDVFVFFRTLHIRLIVHVTKVVTL